MSAVPQLAIDNENPWPGLSAFDEAAELRRLVLNAPLTVLFGASGLGKTSLIQAGLFPLLRKEYYLPVYVRLDVRDRAAPLVDQVTFALQQQLRAGNVDAPQWREQESLWEYLHRPLLELWSAQNQLVTPLFVFDQFEEVCTLGLENASAIRQLRIDLANLIENRIPDSLARSIRSNGVVAESIALDRQRYKVLLSFREDFLPALEGWKRDIPSMMKNRLRLLPMSQERAFEAVYETAPLLVTENLAREIVDFVSATRDVAAGPTAESVSEGGELNVEPALLSLVCHGLNEKRKAQNKTAFDRELLSCSKESIIADFYHKSVADMPPRVRRFIQEELITDRGFRKPCYVDDAYTRHGVTDHQLRLLVDRRLLRMEPYRGTERVELTHDLLTGVVREYRDRERTRRQRKRVAAFAALAVVLALSLFGVWYVVSEGETDELLRIQAEWNAAQAQKQGQQAGSNAAKADLQRFNAESLAAQANQSKKTALESAAEADHERKVALAANTATKALSVQQPDLALLLAAESTRNADAAVGLSSLLTVLQSYANLRFFIRDHTNPVIGLAFNGDNLISADTGGTVLTHSNEGAQIGRSVVDSPGLPVLMSPDGALLASAGPNRIQIWTAGGRKVQEISSTRSSSIAFSGDGKSTFSLTYDQQHGPHLTLWNLTENRSRTLTLKSGNVDPATAIALNQDATKLAIWTHESIAVWEIQDVNSPTEPTILNMKTEKIGVLQFDPKGNILASGTPEGIVLSNLKSQAQTIIPGWQATSLAFSPDGALLASGSRTGEVSVWRTESISPIWTRRSHGSPVTRVVFSVDGKQVASAAGSEIALLSVAQESLGQSVHYADPPNSPWCKSGYVSSIKSDV